MPTIPPIITYRSKQSLLTKDEADANVTATGGIVDTLGEGHSRLSENAKGLFKSEEAMLKASTEEWTWIPTGEVLGNYLVGQFRTNKKLIAESGYLFEMETDGEEILVLESM